MFSSTENASNNSFLYGVVVFDIDSFKRYELPTEQGSSSSSSDSSVPPPPKKQKSQATLQKESEERKRQEEEDRKEEEEREIYNEEQEEEERRIYNEREVPKMNRQIERYRPKGKVSIPDGFFELREFGNGPTLHGWPPRFQKLSPGEKRSVWISDIWGSDALRKIKQDKLLKGNFGKVKR